jgi:uridine kinase
LELLNTLIYRINQARQNHRTPFKIAIDGLDGAGKSTFARELFALMQMEKYPVFQSSIDNFHNSRKIRYSLGERSPEGYYKYSFNYEILLEYLLLPLMESEDIKVRGSAFDHKQDIATKTELVNVSSDTILLFDGIFLLRPRLQKYWDMHIFIHADIDNILARVKARDEGNASEIETLYLEKYIPGQILYLKECKPHLHTDILINNNNFDHPFFMVNRREQELFLQHTINYFESKQVKNEI